jgi:hypothetical protein
VPVVPLLFGLVGGALIIGGTLVVCYLPKHSAE